MSHIRVLVGTRKGAFILTSDATRHDWKVAGPFFGGWEIFHIAGSPANPDRLFVSQNSSWFGQVIQRSDDGGLSWSPVSNTFDYAGDPGSHQHYDGTPKPWVFKRVWHLAPSPADPDTVYAAVEDAALFRSQDGGLTWHELPGLREQKGAKWMPGAGGMCLHTILLDPVNPARMYVAISAAGTYRSDNGGATWRPINRGLHSQYIPDPEAEVGHCVHRIAMHPARPETLFVQKHWDVMRSDDAGESWYEVSGNLPSDFGFAMALHAHEPDTVYAVPMLSDSEHYPPEGKLRVYRSKTGGNKWDALIDGLPQAHCYVNVLRDAMTVDRLDPCGVYFGTTGGQVYASPDGGDHWIAIVHELPDQRPSAAAHRRRDCRGLRAQRFHTPRSPSMIDIPHLTDSAEKFAAVIHLDIPRADMMKAFGPAVSELLTALTVQGIAPQGAAFAHHLGTTPERFNFELGFFVATPIVASARVQPGVLRAARVARTVYHGAYEGLPDAWGELMRWIETCGHTPAADLWEWYVVGPHLSPNPADWRTELSRPLMA